MSTPVALHAAPENHPNYPTWKYVAPLPSPPLMKNVGSRDVESFLVVGDAWAQVITKFLRSDDTVLDIGCGCGRIARFLINLPDIRYIGFDIFKANIEWCATNLTPLSGGRFQFHHFDGKSEFYNPEGTIETTDYRFPAEDASVDFVFAASIFTHLKEPDALHYLWEAHRVLKPGGLALFSIHIEPRGRPYSGSEGRIDIEPAYFVRIASRSGLVLKERIGDLLGQEVFLFENIAEPRPEKSGVVSRLWHNARTRAPFLTQSAEDDTPVGDRARALARQLAPRQRFGRVAGDITRLPQQVGAHERSIRDLQARLARLESPTQVPPPAIEQAAPGEESDDPSALPMPLPPEALRERVNGSPDVESFVQVGRQCAHDIEAAVRSAGHDTSSLRTVLDFGCGCGRTLIHLAPRWEHARFFGTDIDAEAIAWCRDNLAFGTFSRNDALPPLPYQDNTFDLVYAVSVFTHLNQEFQHQWLAELQRITAPGGLVAISLHGQYYADQPELLSAESRATLDAEGFAFVPAPVPDSPFPEWYQVAFHTKEYVLAEFSKFFTVLEYIPMGLNYHQDLVMLKKE